MGSNICHIPANKKKWRQTGRWMKELCRSNADKSGSVLGEQDELASNTGTRTSVQGGDRDVEEVKGLVFEEWPIQKMSSPLHGKPRHWDRVKTMFSYYLLKYCHHCFMLIATAYIEIPSLPKESSPWTHDWGSPLSPVGPANKELFHVLTAIIFIWSTLLILITMILLIYKYWGAFLIPTTTLCFLNVSTSPYIFMSLNKIFLVVPYMKIKSSIC